MGTRMFGPGAVILGDRSFQLLLVAGFMGVSGIAIVSPILERLLGPFGASAAEIGLIITALSAPGIVLIPLSGLLADRFGRKPILISGLLLFGSAGAAIAATTDFPTVLALRVLQGIGIAGINPVIITSIGDLYTGEQEAAGQGFRMVVTGVSFALFPILASLLVGAAWQLPFLLYGLSLPIAVLLFVFFDEPMGTRADGAALQGDTPRSDGHYVRRVARLATRPPVAGIIVARPLSVVAPIGVITYNSLVVVRVLDGNPQHAGVVIASLAGVQALVSSQIGRLSAALDDPRRALIGANLCLGGGTVLFAAAPTLPVALVGGALVGVGGGIGFPLYRSFITTAAVESLRAGLVSVAEASNRAAVTMTPIVMGAVIAVVETSLGTAAAVRWTVAGGGVVGAGLGLVFVVVSWLGDRR